MAVGTVVARTPGSPGPGRAGATAGRYRRRVPPVIGITSRELPGKNAWGPRVQGQYGTYVDSVVAAGGIPLLLPMVDDPAVNDELARRIDALLVPGGEDVTPARYGAEPSPYLEATAEERDHIELDLLGRLLSAGKPVLAICRGMQLLNVHLGGTLYQHLPAEFPSEVDHRAGDVAQDIEHLSHPLTLAPDSWLARVLGPDPIPANAHHHQGVKDLAPGLRATAWTADGLVEGLEDASGRFVVGVQCHPESLHRVEPRWTALFRAYVAEASRAPRLAA